MDGFMELLPIHEFGKLQRQTLLLTALSTSESKKRENIAKRWGGALWHAAAASKGLVAREAESLGLFLLPNRRLGRHFTGAEEEETAMVDSLGLFLLP
jgi:hypothetical protein